jgi:hypothetical protein
MDKPFKIVSFASSKKISGILERAGFEKQDDAAITASLAALAHFLEEHGLVTQKLLENGKLRGGESFELSSSDLTEQGLAVIRAGLVNWQKKGRPANDIRSLERAYKKVADKQKHKTK